MQMGQNRVPNSTQKQHQNSSEPPAQHCEPGCRSRQVPKRLLQAPGGLQSQRVRNSSPKPTPKIALSPHHCKPGCRSRQAEALEVRKKKGFVRIRRHVRVAIFHCGLIELFRITSHRNIISFAMLPRFSTLDHEFWLCSGFRALRTRTWLSLRLIRL